MSGNLIFNASICIVGIAILLIHTVNLFIKKNKRKDEFALLNFLLLTIAHFSIYLAFTFLRVNYTNKPFIIGFYTTFYIFNNLEAFFLYFYVTRYVEFNHRIKNILTIAVSILLGIFITLDFINIPTGIFFYYDGADYARSGVMIVSQIYQFIILAIVFMVALLNKKLVIRERIAFFLYCLLPGVAIVLQNAFKGYAIAYLSIIIAIEILFFFLNVQKNIQLVEEQQKNKEAQIKIMMSQIQPHFIYNSLSSISTLIPLDPNKAQNALDDFTEYLRHNLSSLTETKLIPFEDELRHIQTYVSLEKVRFNDRVNVIYDIEVKDFSVPPLSIQPIVENAIKHGILKKIEGGTISIKTYSTKDSYVVEVIDNGVGFDMNSIDFEANKHFGINNIRHRIKSMCNGSLEIISEINKGTKAVITFKKG